jgi:hypothetical protein
MGNRQGNSSFSANGHSINSSSVVEYEHKKASPPIEIPCCCGDKESSNRYTDCDGLLPTYYIHQYEPYRGGESE